MYGGTSPSGGEKPLLVPLELAGKPLTRIENRKLGWVLGAGSHPGFNSSTLRVSFNFCLIILKFSFDSGVLI